MFADVIVSAGEMRRVEQMNFAEGHADAAELMLIAGKGCAELFCRYFRTLADRRRVVIFAGHGNNGGDGAVIADELVKVLDIPVVLAMALPVENSSECSRYYLERLSPAVIIAAADSVQLDEHDTVIDALLGTGCRAPIRQPYGDLIEKINAARLPVFAVDLPSGLGADKCVKADFTAVIGYFKDQLFSDEGIADSGKLRRVPLPLTLLPDVPQTAPRAADLDFYRRTSVPVDPQTHKYRRGSVLVIGGSAEYTNAPFLTARSALRSGAGLVRTAVPFTPPIGGCLSIIPMPLANENGSFCADSWDDLQGCLPKINAVAAGPGMGRRPSCGDLVEKVLTIEQPLLLDADALFHAAGHLELLRARRGLTVLTPHRGEAAHLAAAWKLDLPADNAAAAQMLASTANAVVLLKGARTAIAAPDGMIMLNTSGTASLATAGSGDCLSGLIAAELCHAVDVSDVWTAAARGAFLHGLAGSLAEMKFGSCGVIADDLPEYMAMASERVCHCGDIF